jgi:hypothetical protein
LTVHTAAILSNISAIFFYELAATLPIFERYYKWNAYNKERKYAGEAFRVQHRRILCDVRTRFFSVILAANLGRYAEIFRAQSRYFPPIFE